MRTHLIILLMLPILLVAQVNPFLPQTPPADTVLEDSEAPVNELGNLSNELTSRTPFLGSIIELQKELHSKISLQMRALKENFSLLHLTIFLLAAFAYGIIHSLGPGHAKLLIGSKLLSSQHKRSDALKAGSVFAFTHTGVALVLFLVVTLLLKLSSSDSSLVADRLLTVSGVMIIVTAIYLIWEVISDWKHRHQSEDEKNENSRSLYLLALFAGLSPCPGALLILIFSNLIGISGYGVLAVVAVSLGMAITVSSIGWITVVGRETIQATVKSKAKITSVIIPLFRISGALLILVIGWSFL